METVKIATGSFNIKGEWIDPNGQYINGYDEYQIPDGSIFSGTVVGDYPLYVGGSSERTNDPIKQAYIKQKLGIEKDNYFVAGDLANYKTQLNGWSNVVEIPIGCKFTIECLSKGDVMCFTRFKVTIHHSEEEIKKLEYKYRLKKLDEEYDEDHTLHREVNVTPF